jgi:plasmid stabilization system protein ParE
VTVRLAPEAFSDLQDARSWYAERGRNLADRFVQSFEAVLRNLEAHPEAYPVIHRQVRRALLRDFPYCVFYVSESEGPLVVGCFHARRDPAAWRRRAGA